MTLIDWRVLLLIGLVALGGGMVGGWAGMLVGTMAILLIGWVWYWLTRDW
jgi:hypothetical protein